MAEKSSSNEGKAFELMPDICITCIGTITKLRIAIMSIILKASLLSLFYYLANLAMVKEAELSKRKHGFLDESTCFPFLIVPFILDNLGKISEFLKMIVFTSKKVLLIAISYF